MKNLNVTFYILSAFLAFSLMSCEKDKPLEKTIIGKWELTSMKQITYENTVRKSDYILYYEPGERAYQFVEGGSGIYSEDAEDYLFSWSITGTKITLSDLYSEDLVVSAAIEDDILTWSHKEPDSQNPIYMYEYIMTARKIR